MAIVHIMLSVESPTACLLCTGACSWDLSNRPTLNMLKVYLGPIGLPWAVLGYLFDLSNNKTSFYPTKLKNQKNTQWENSSGVYANFRSFSAAVRSLPADVHSFSGRELTKSCQIKVSAHVMFFRSTSETSKQLPRAPKKGPNGRPRYARCQPYKTTPSLNKAALPPDTYILETDKVRKRKLELRPCLWTRARAQSRPAQWAEST